MQGLKALFRLPWLWRAQREERALARGRHHELAVCAIFREEAPFLEEWISFHIGIGATHFYLYNNFSTDNFRAVLAPWIARGLVTLHDWPRPVGQYSAYAHCVRRAIRSPHIFHYWSGGGVDTARRSLAAGRVTPVFDRLRYNHYWSRSLADLRTKVARGDSSAPEPRDLAWHLQFEASLNAQEDRTILPIMERIRAAERLAVGE